MLWENYGFSTPPKMQKNIAHGRPDFSCLLASILGSMFMKFRDPTEPSVLQQVSSEMPGFACPRLPCLHQKYKDFSCFFWNRPWTLLFPTFMRFYAKKCDFGMPPGTHWGPKWRPKSDFFAISAGNLPTPRSARGSARVPSNSDCHTARKAHLAGIRAPFGVGRIPGGVAKKSV